MNAALIIMIIESALKVLSQVTTGRVKTGVDIASELEAIVSKAAAAYKAHTGEEINPNLLKPEEPLP